MNTIQIDAMWVTVIGGFITILLAIIATFFHRLLTQFDEMGRQFAVLNETMTKIDKDLSGDVNVLKVRVQEFDDVWDRLRSAEQSIVALQRAGCDVVKTCRVA